MDGYAKLHGQPAFVLGLGDNFYDDGVDSVDDPKWKSFWVDSYLTYESLRVPWKAVLGNHDYDGNPDAQIDFTTHVGNPPLPPSFGPCEFRVFPPVKPSAGSDKSSQEVQASANRIWQMPGRSYAFSEADGLIDFFVLDTNAIQWAVRHCYPGANKVFKRSIKTLGESLKASTAQWKVVLGHHPM